MLHNEDMMAFSHSFTPDFYANEETGGLYPEPSTQPASVIQAVISMQHFQPELWEEMAREVFGIDDPKFLCPFDVTRKIEETNTVGDIRTPIDVWIDPEGSYRVDVYDVTRLQIFGHLGDVNALECGGGFIFKDEDSGYQWLWFWEGMDTMVDSGSIDDNAEAEDVEFTVHQVSLDDDIKEDLCWVDEWWMDRESKNLDLSTPQDKGWLAYEAAKYYGAQDLDAYPVKISGRRLKEMFDL